MQGKMREGSKEKIRKENSQTQNIRVAGWQKVVPSSTSTKRQRPQARMDQTVEGEAVALEATQGGDQMGGTLSTHTS